MEWEEGNEAQLEPPEVLTTLQLHGACLDVHGEVLEVHGAGQDQCQPEEAEERKELLELGQ